ncbi:hypothetical protein ACP275_02G164600 [Erythranthe tilingii]
MLRKQPTLSLRHRLPPLPPTLRTNPHSTARDPYFTDDLYETKKSVEKYEIYIFKVLRFLLFCIIFPLLRSVFPVFVLDSFYIFSAPFSHLRFRFVLYFLVFVSDSFYIFPFSVFPIFV